MIKILNKLKEFGLSDEQIDELQETINDNMSDLIPVHHLKKDCINFMDIPTGMMPRIEAEEYMRNLGKQMKPLTKEYDNLLLARSRDCPSTVVSYLEKDKVNMLEFTMGMMPEEKAHTYLNKLYEILKIYEEQGYKFVVTGRGNNPEEGEYCITLT